MSQRPASILETIAAWSAATPGKEALVFLSSDGQTERITYGDLLTRVQRQALLLHALPSCRRIGLMAPHGPEFLVEALAILSAGHCLVPINEQLTPCQHDELASRAGIHALRQTGKPGLTLCTGQPIDLAGDDDFRALSPAYLRFTSGSTGPRKGVLLGHRTLLERTAAANARLKISPADRVLCLLPMVDHWVVSILLYLRYGATILLVENDGDAPFLAQAEKATVLYGSPSQYRGFGEPLPRVRLAVSTTQGLSLPLAHSFLANTGRPLTQALGIIEVGLLTLNDAPGTMDPLLAGIPMPDYRLTIASTTGQAGEIHVAGPGLLDAYISPWRPRSSLLTAHGLPTGDHGWLDAAGCLHLVGREKNRVELRGVAFFCEEIEALINQYPGVRESLVFQKEGQLFAQVVALWSADESATLAHWLGQKLSFDPVPIEIEQVDTLPRTPTGKLSRPISAR